jgi:hypothetical protein
MQVRMVPQNEGLPAKVVLQMLAEGWVCLSGASIQSDAPQIAQPGMPYTPRVGLFDIWALPQPMMPQMVVAQALLAAASQGGDVKTLETLSQTWFGASLEQVQAGMRGNVAAGAANQGK